MRCALLSCCRQTDWNWLSVKVTSLDSGVIGSVWKRVTSAAAAAASASANSRPFRVDVILVALRLNFVALFLSLSEESHSFTSSLALLLNYA